MSRWWLRGMVSGHRKSGEGGRGCDDASIVTPYPYGKYIASFRGKATSTDYLFVRRPLLGQIRCTPLWVDDKVWYEALDVYNVFRTSGIHTYLTYLTSVYQTHKHTHIHTQLACTYSQKTNYVKRIELAILLNAKTTIARKIWTKWVDKKGALLL